MKHAGCTRSAIDAFVHNYEQLRSAASMMIPEDAIFPARRPPPQHRPPLPRRHPSPAPPAAPPPDLPLGLAASPRRGSCL
jgi:hypothetical protein